VGEVDEMDDRRWSVSEIDEWCRGELMKVRRKEKRKKEDSPVYRDQQ
jgi:hypothetical protein